MIILYHFGKTNIVAAALSRLYMGSAYYDEEDKRELANDVNTLARLGVGLMDVDEDGMVVISVVKPH